MLIRPADQESCLGKVNRDPGVSSPNTAWRVSYVLHLHLSTGTMGRSELAPGTEFNFQIKDSNIY